MSKAIILTESQAWDRYGKETTTEAIIAREALRNGFNIAIVESEYFSSSLLVNTPFLIDFSINLIKKEIKREVKTIRLVNTKLLSEDKLIVAYC